MPVPNNTAPATDKPVAPAAVVAPAPAVEVKTAVTSDTVKVEGGKKTYTVAPGRSVTHGEDHEKDKDGRITKEGMPKHYAAGQKVDLDEADASRLIDLGFLLAPDGSVVIHPDGPATDVENGVAITTDTKEGAQISESR